MGANYAKKKEFQIVSVQNCAFESLLAYIRMPPSKFQPIFEVHRFHVLPILEEATKPMQAATAKKCLQQLSQKT